MNNLHSFLFAIIAKRRIGAGLGDESIRSMFSLQDIINETLLRGIMRGILKHGARVWVLSTAFITVRFLSIYDSVNYF